MRIPHRSGENVRFLFNPDNFSNNPQWKSSECFLGSPSIIWSLFSRISPKKDSRFTQHHKFLWHSGMTLFLCSNCISRRRHGMERSLDYWTFVRVTHRWCNALFGISLFLVWASNCTSVRVAGDFRRHGASVTLWRYDMHTGLFVFALTWLYCSFNGLEHPVMAVNTCQNGLSLIPVWMSDHIYSKVWDEITYPFPNFNGCTIEVLEQVISSHAL